MKKIMSIMLGMSLVIGAASLSFGQATTGTTTKKSTKKTTTKSSKPKSTATKTS